MKKLIFFIVGFTISFVFLTIYSTHRVYIEIETNAPQAIQITNWGKSFDHIKYPEKNKVTFWHRFHTIKDRISFEFPKNTTLEITAIKAAGKTYMAQEIEKFVTGQTNIESIHFNQNKNVLEIKTQKGNGEITTSLNALTDLQKRFKYVPLITSLIIGTVLLVLSSKICSFKVNQLEKSTWIESTLNWIETRTTRDFVIISILLLFLTFAYLTLSPPLVSDNLCAHFPFGGIFSRWFCEERLFGHFLYLIFPLFDTIPFFFSFFGAVFLFLTAFVYTKTFKATPIQKLSIYLILLTFPTWSYIWVFFFMSLQTGLFAMLAVISFYFFIRNNNGQTLPIRDYIIALIFFFFACWGFETTPTIFFVLLATWLLTVHFNKLTFLQLVRQGIFALSITGACCISTQLLGKFSRIILGSPKSTYFEETYNHFSGGFTFDSYISSISEGLLQIFKMFPWDWYMLIWFLLIPATLIVVFVKSQNKKKVLHLLILLGMIISPFLLTFLAGCATPPRACVAYPFMVTGLAFILLYHVKTRWMIFLIIGLCFAIMLKSTFYINKRNFYENKQKELIEFKTDRIVNMIYDLNADLLPLILVGQIDNTVQANTDFSVPIFYPPYHFFFFKGHTPQNEPTDKAYNWAVDVSQFWPSYPNKNCAKVVDSVMIIKLSESTFKEDRKSN